MDYILQQVTGMYVTRSVSQVSVRLRRGVLRATRPRLRDLSQRHGPHHHRVHRGALRRHLSPVLRADTQQAIPRSATRPGHLGCGLSLRYTPGKPRPLNLSSY